MTITEGYVVEVGRGRDVGNTVRIWFQEDPRPYDNCRGHLDRKRWAPQEACVFAYEVPKAVAPLDRIVIQGNLMLWYPDNKALRRLTLNGEKYEFPAGWCMAVELVPGTVPIDPRGRKLIKAL